MIIRLYNSKNVLNNKGSMDFPSYSAHFYFFTRYDQLTIPAKQHAILNQQDIMLPL